MKQACMLFVPQVKDSQICGVCRYPVYDHSHSTMITPAPIPFSSSHQSYRAEAVRPVYVSAAELPRTARISPIMKPQSQFVISSTSSLPTNSFLSSYHSSRTNALVSPSIQQHKITTTFAQSETSAFSQYSKSSSAESTFSSTSTSTHSATPAQNLITHQRSASSRGQQGNEDSYALRRCKTFTNNILLLKPRPQYFKPVSCISEPVTPDNVPTIQVEDPSPKQDRVQSNIYRRIRAKNKERNSSAQRSSSPSPPSSPSDDEKRGDSSRVSTRKEAVPRAYNFRQILDRFQSASDQQVMREQSQFRSLRSRDPNRRITVDTFTLQQTTTTAPLEYHLQRQKFESASTPFTITIPTNVQKTYRNPLPDRWLPVKETDIDDIPPAPIISEQSVPSPIVQSRNIPIHQENTKSSTYFTPKKMKCQDLIRRFSNDSLKGNDSTKLRDRFGRLIPKTRPQSHSDLQHSGDSSSTVSKFDRKSGRSSLTVSIPINDENVSAESPVPCTPSSMSRASSVLTPSSYMPPTPVTNQRAKSIDHAYNQMTLNHRESLAYISEHLADYIRCRDVPLSKEKLDSLKFNEIIFDSYTPTLIKGASLFFDASVAEGSQPPYDITLMVAPASQYYPLSLGRKPPEAILYNPPVLVEIDDNDGEIRRFLQDSSHLSGRTCKAFVMPRLTLLSFHSLAAHSFDKRMSAEAYERHVCFIMLQLVCALKSLQSDGVEHLSNNFREFLLAYRSTYFNSPMGIAEYPRIMLLRETVSDDLEESNENGSVGVCKYAVRALCTLLHQKMDYTVPLIPYRSQYSDALLKCAELLNDEKSSSLSDAKNILEFRFWVDANQEFDSEFDAKIWIDSQRSRDVNRLLRAFVSNSESLKDTLERLRVQFLLSATPRSLFTSFETLRKLGDRSSSNKFTCFI